MRRPLFLAVFMAVALALNLTGVAAAQSLHPGPSQAPYDTEVLFHDGCLGFESKTKPPWCTFGNKHGSYTVVVVGDSHASAIFPAFQRIAADHGNWRLIPLVKIDCPFIDMKIRSAHANSNGVHPYYPTCETWNANVVTRLKKIKPDLVVTMIFKGIFPMNASDDTATKTGQAVGRMLAKVPGQKIVIQDSPYSYRNVPDCVRNHPANHWAYCDIPKYQVMSDGVGKREGAAASVGHGTAMDLTSLFCGGVFPCEVVSPGNILKYRDGHHFTETYAKSLGPAIYSRLDPFIHD